MLRALVALIAICGVVRAAPPRVEEDPTQPSTSAAARADAARSIPIDELAADLRRPVANVVKHAGIFRRLPVAVVQCDPDLYRFVIRRPEVIVNLWQVMGATNVTMERTGDGVYSASDGAGTKCTIRYVHVTDDTHIIYADGAYSGPLFLHPVRTKTVLILKSAFVKTKDGRPLVTSRMDAFVHVENGGLELIAKTVQPLVGKAADHNFAETTGFVGSLARAIDRNRTGVQRLGTRLTKVDGQTREDFIALVGQVPAFPAPSEGGNSTASDTKTARQPAESQRRPATKR